MEIETTYALKLFFPNPAFVQVYFEAIANAIDANADKIEILIRLDGKISDPDSLEITIQDNGEGFTEERYERFRQLKEPQDAFHKGLGRLIYLQYFSEVTVTSIYAKKERKFRFVHNFDGVCDLAKSTTHGRKGTKLVFRTFRGRRVKSYNDLKPTYLKQSILEQFLPVLYARKLSGNPVEIRIALSTEARPQRELYSETQTLSADDLPDLKTTSIKADQIDLFEQIEVSYAIKTGQSNPLVLTAADIDGRTVPLDLLDPKSLPLGTSVIFLFASKLFEGNSDSARQRLVPPDGVQMTALAKVLKQEIGRILSEELPEIKVRNESTKERFEDRFPHLIGLFDEDTVGLIDREEAIETAQKRFFKQQRDVIESDPTDDTAFERSLEMSARSLTEYILYRDWVIKRLNSVSAADREATLHDLIVPRYARFEQPNFVDDVYRNNAWIFDDKFMTFRTILSESTMDEVIKAITLEEDVTGDDGRPDISMIFSADPEKEARVDVVVVELKRKKIDDKEATYAAVQLAKRARLLVDHCPNIQRVWYYGIIEIDDRLAQLLIDLKWVPLYSKGRVFYQDFSLTRKSDNVPIPTPTFLLSFDAIAADALARNHAFLELLKKQFKGKVAAITEPPAEGSRL